MKLYYRIFDPELFKSFDISISEFERRERPDVNYIRIDWNGDTYEYCLKFLEENGYYYEVAF